MKRRFFSIILVIVSVFMILHPIYALTPVEVGRICSITVEGYPGEGAHFRFYKIADADENMEFTLTDAFKPYEETVIVNNIHDQDTWMALAQTLPSYVSGDGISADVEGYYQNGTMTVQLETGLYLMLSDPVTADGWIHKTIPMLISVPTGDDYIPNVDEWIYDYTVIPKQTKEKPSQKEKEYKVVKQWQDGNGTKRPTVIKVNVLKNDEIVEQVELNKDNDWCYKWKAVDDGSEWTVQEVEIPKGYHVTISGNETGYVIRNYTETSTTADTTDTRTPMIVLCISGTCALLAGYLLLTSRREEE